MTLMVTTTFNPVYLMDLQPWKQVLTHWGFLKMPLSGSPCFLSLTGHWLLFFSHLSDSSCCPLLNILSPAIFCVYTPCFGAHEILWYLKLQDFMSMKAVKKTHV